MAIDPGNDVCGGATEVAPHPMLIVRGKLLTRENPNEAADGCALRVRPLRCLPKLSDLSASLASPKGQSTALIRMSSESPPAQSLGVRQGPGRRRGEIR